MYLDNPIILTTCNSRFINIESITNTNTNTTNTNHMLHAHNRTALNTHTTTVHIGIGPNIVAGIGGLGASISIGGAHGNYLPNRVCVDIGLVPLY